ncbi:MAG: hypothetical protein QM723_16025 [Myxococcaceae bacterium]
MLLTVILAIALSAEPKEPPAELMSRLAAHNDGMEKLIDHYVMVVESKSSEDDSDGKPLHRSQSVARVVSEGGKRRTKVVSATKDGKDDLERAQKEATEQDEKDERHPSPFISKMQSKYRFTDLGQTPEGQLVIGFVPKSGPSSDSLDGEAVVDAQAGELVKMKCRLSENPAFVDKLDMTMDFGATVEGKRALSAMTFDGSGGFLFYKRRGSAVLKFTYEPRPGPN